MIKLINNEFIKIKKSKLLFTQFMFVITIIIINKYSSNLKESVFNLIPFLGIIVCILFGGIISSERENGTFRYYMTKPVKRWKVYLSKLISIIIYITVSNTIIVLLTCLLSSSFSISYIIKFVKYSIPVYFIGFYILYLSTVFKSQTFISSIGIVTLSFSLILSQVLFGIRVTLIEYTFMPYLDFSLFNDKLVLNDINNDLGVHLSLYRGIVIDIVYMIIFYLIGNYKFIKKDIKC